MSNQEKRHSASEDELARFAGEGLLDEVGPYVLMGMIRATQAEIERTNGEVEGCVFNLDSDDPQNVLATTVNIRPEEAVIQFGYDSDQYSLSLKKLNTLIQERIAETPPEAHSEAS